ncbi:MAG TPA: ATP-dependent RecD-like DNA helicase, partial [Ktedonobacterales bacterium]|nr:ATP-dependent RecD-like DNA helicase [Ktedonobacterales bacterium]
MGKITTSEQSSLEYVQGVIERLTYHAENSGYSVARMHVAGQRDLVTIVGAFADIQPGQTLRLAGHWREHPQYGPQFQVVRYQELQPATLTGIEKYLGSGLIKGVGPMTAKKIVAYFKRETLDIIEQDSERLIEVPGIGAKRVERIRTAWAAQKIVKEVMLYLSSHGVSPTYAAKIYKQYGAEAITIVTENPYRLASDIYGIGFITADTIARNVGVAPDSEFRYRAGISYVLQLASDDGHCFLPENELAARAAKHLALPDYPVDPERIHALVEQMTVSGELLMQPGMGEWVEQPLYYAPAFYHTEVSLAARLSQFATRPLDVDRVRVQRWIDGYTTKLGIDLSPEQRQAVEMAATERVMILTGGPGCGKTFTTRTIVALWKAMGRSLMLAAPTGRAAQRLTELTGWQAKTVHRLLAFDPGTMQFRYHQDQPLEAQAVVVDEASMLELFLAQALAKAIPPDAQLLLVGDADQLPSVGPGNVLRDLIGSECLPVARLTQIFRQVAESQIVTTAHTINQGKFPQLTPLTRTPAADCLWVDAAEPEQGVAVLRHLIEQTLPRLGIDPVREVQVLAPATRGESGTRQLNQMIQTALNPPQAGKMEMQRGTQTLRAGDRVIQQVNDYQREVFNGDVGTITTIDMEEHEVSVQYGERQVIYDFADLSEIALAWAITVHKSQGSEYPVVLLPLFMQH